VGAVVGVDTGAAVAGAVICVVVGVVFVGVVVGATGFVTAFTASVTGASESASLRFEWTIDQTRASAKPATTANPIRMIVARALRIPESPKSTMGSQLPAHHRGQPGKLVRDRAIRCS
jgi:hypothetical protein